MSVVVWMSAAVWMLVVVELDLKDSVCIVDRVLGSAQQATDGLRDGSGWRYTFQIPSAIVRLADPSHLQRH